MVSGLVVPADQAMPTQAVDVATAGDLERYLGGWPEAVDLVSLGSTLFVNDAGLPLGLPMNIRATFFWWLYEPRARDRHRLVGDVLVLGARSEVRDLEDLAVEVTKSWLEPKLFVVEVQHPKSDGWLRLPSDYDDYFEALSWAVVMANVDLAIADIRVRPA